MHVENVTVEVLKALPDGEVRDLRHRFIILYSGNYAKDPKATVGGLSESEFADRYVLLRHEMEHRDMRIMTETALDRLVKGAMVRKATWGGLDVPSLGDLTVAESYVSIEGPFVRDPGGGADLGIIIRDAEENRDKELELRLGRLLSRETRKACSFTYIPQGPQSTFLPVFDLVLRARPGNRIEEVSGVSDVLKALSPADQKACDEESERIRENKKGANASRPHKFQPARFTHPNGHPRCLVCGDEEAVGGICNKTLPPAEADRQFAHWYETGEWLKKVAEAGEEGRAALIEEARQLGIELDKGGEGSGNYGHGGRPGEVGGSGEGGEGYKDFGAVGQGDIETPALHRVNEWGEGALNPGVTLSSAERNGVADYQSYAYRDINGVLRQERTEEGVFSSWGETPGQVRMMDSVMDKSTLQEHVIAYRGLDEKTFGRMKEGGKFKDRAYVSTSLSRTVAADGSFGNCMVKIEVPKGTRALYVGHRASGIGSEMELILDRSSRFDVVNVDKKNKTATIRLIGQRKGGG